QERCGALVSELAGDRPLGQRSDLLAHEGVLEHLAQAQIPVLPFRFGAVMTGPSEVASELLAVHQERFLAELRHLAGGIELVVKGRYESDRAYLRCWPRTRSCWRCARASRASLRRRATKSGSGSVSWSPRRWTASGPWTASA